MKTHALALAWALGSILSASSPAIPGSSPELRINTTAGAPELPYVAFDAGGNVVVVWNDRHGPRILGRRFDGAGIPLGDDFRVSFDHPSSDLFGPQVVPAPDGGFLVVWFEEPDTGSETTVFARRFDKAGKPRSGELKLRTIHRHLGLASGPAGSFLLLWTPSSQMEILGQWFDSRGKPMGERLAFPSSLPIGYRAAVATNAAGNSVVAWSGFQGSGWDLLVRRYDAAGSPLSDEITLATETGSLFLPSYFGQGVTSDATGNFVVVWREPSGTSVRGIYARRFDDSGRPLGERVEVSPTTLSAPAMANDAAGGFLVVWLDEWGPEEKPVYFGRHFSPTVEPEGTRFRISFSSPLYEPVAAVAGDGMGGYMVAYEVYDYVSYDIFGRRLGRDERGGTLQFLPDSFSLVEGHTDFSGIEGGTAAITVLRTGGSEGEVSVELSVEGGTATAGQDFVMPSQVLVFSPEGPDTQSLFVDLLDDEAVEGNETVVYRLANPSSEASLVEPTTATLTLFENDFSEPGSRPLALGPAFQVASSPKMARRNPEPDVAVAPDGEFVIAWVRQVEGGYYGSYDRLIAQRYRRLGTPRGDEIAVNAADPERPPRLVNDPVVTFDHDGSCVVVWKENYASFEDSIRGRAFSPAGEALTEDFEIANVVGDSFLNIGLRNTGAVRSADSRFFVTWTKYFQGRHGETSESVFGQLIGRDGALLGPLFRQTYDYMGFSFPPSPAPAVAATPAGQILLTWQWFDLDSVDEPLRLLSQRFASDGEPQGRTSEVGYGDQPAIAATGGKFVVVWDNHPYGQGDHEPGDLLARFLDSDGQPLGATFQVNSFTPGRQRLADVAADAAGNFVVVWQSDVLQASDSGPQIAQDGSGSGVFGQRFNSVGGRVGGEFQISTATLGDQRGPAVAAASTGEFVAVWESEREDGGFDVLARRFSPNACVEDAVTLCLGDGRFRVQARWRDFAGKTGQGRAKPLTADTGTFWFFNPDNVEVVLKVLDGRKLNGHFWVFYGALSNVEYTLTVTDTTNGATREYVNPLHEFASVGDTGALPGNGVTGSVGVLPRPAATAQGKPVLRQGGCAADATTLCLNDERFRISIRWRDFTGRTGTGTAVPLTADTGYFWFFNDANVEVVIKVLDGRRVNGHFWVFYGALSNVEYTLTVTDTETGESRQYFNPSGHFASVGDPEAFLVN